MLALRARMEVLGTASFTPARAAVLDAERAHDARAGGHGAGVVRVGVDDEDAKGLRRRRGATAG